VLFLFQAFVDVLLKPTFHAETEALLALEEPEAHLHPHATRALTIRLNRITAQKVISTHSPYVLQCVPSKDIRLFRRDGAKVSVSYVRRDYSIALPPDSKLVEFCQQSNGKFQYDNTFQQLIVKEAVAEAERRKLLIIFAARGELHAPITRFTASTRFHLSDDELVSLDTFAKRIRGEIFFARAWLLCEGQSEFLLLTFFAELLGTPLDRHGVSVIDYQNNGAPGVFIKLAENLRIPWLLLCDSDQAGQGYALTVTELGFPTADLPLLARPLPIPNMDLEGFLVRSGFGGDYETLLKGCGKSLSTKAGDTGYEDEIATIPYAAMSETSSNC
jgi:putative ATP-dependent endonuclease of OLD family